MDRRSFIEKIGGIGAAGVALSAFPWMQSCTPEADGNVKGEVLGIGVIGPGSRGRYHLTNLVKIPQAKVVALCDTYAPSMEKALAICPDARQYTDYRKLLEDKEVDAVVIATPLHLHYQMTMDALSAGKHVICEKAMAYTMEQCLEMYHAGRASGKVFFVAQQRIFDPKYLKAIEQVRNGDFGPVVNVRNYWFRNGDWRRAVPSPEYERHINWRLYREYSRGLMTELACHQLQNGVFATGMLPEKVMGSGSIIHWKDGREVEDNVCTIYTFPNGVNMTFESVISNKHFGMGEQILCKEGTIDLPNGLYYPETPKRQTAMRQLVSEIERGVFSNPAFAGTSWAAETAQSAAGISIMPEATGPGKDGSFEMMQAFCNCCIEGRQPERVLEDGYYGTVLCLLGDEAILRNEILTFPEKFKL